jgi:hypothetical protein
MSTLQEFLIKSAGMEKEARTAIAKRLLASTMTPQEVFKRFGKVKGNRYLDDITTAVKNHINVPDAYPYTSEAASNRGYLRYTFDQNAAQRLHFSNRLSKSDFLKPVENGIGRPNTNRYYLRHLQRAGSQSGLSDLYNTLPRQDKLIVSKYLRGAIPESGLQHLSTDVQQAAQNARARLLQPSVTPTLPERSMYAKTLQQQYGIIPRDTLVEHITKVIPDYDTSKLTHQNYFIGDTKNLNNKDMLLAALVCHIQILGTCLYKRQ